MFLQFLRLIIRNFFSFSLGLIVAISIVGCDGDNSSSNNGIVPISMGSSNNSPTSSNEGANKNPSDTSNPYGVSNPDRIFQTSNLETTTIKTPGGDLKLWIMDNEDKRREGMMFLKDHEVKDNEGMIFLFPDIQKLSGNYAFWMRNTILALDIDYISKDKKVINVGKGMPMNETPVPPMGDYFYVIEVKQGLSAKFGLVPGAKVQISDDLKGKP